MGQKCSLGWLEKKSFQQFWFLMLNSYSGRKLKAKARSWDISERYLYKGILHHPVRFCFIQRKSWVPLVRVPEDFFYQHIPPIYGLWIKGNVGVICTVLDQSFAPIAPAFSAAWAPSLAPHKATAPWWRCRAHPGEIRIGWRVGLPFHGGAIWKSPKQRGPWKFCLHKSNGHIIFGGSNGLQSSPQTKIKGCEWNHHL